jgi:predicted nuclease of predicted toxin-antitoxin system
MRILADENVHIDIVHGLRRLNYEVLTVYDIALAGHKDNEILEYSERNNLILLSGDKDFGGLIKFAGLWGRGKVILTRHHLININHIVEDVHETLNREAKVLSASEPIVIVISESGYRIHRPTSS